MTTSVTYPADGANRLFSVPFPYISKSHVKVALDGVDLSTSDYTWETSGSIQTVATYAAPSEIRIYRQTPEAALTTYQQGSTLSEDDLETDSLQALYRLEELQDVSDRSLKLPVNVGAVDATLPLPSPLSPLVWNADGSALANGDPNVTGDMLLRPELAAAGAGQGADLVAFQQAGTGAVARTAQEKLRESVFPEDFGAVGDGVADDTTALQQMVDHLEEIKRNDKAAGGIGYFSPGKTYAISSSITINKPIKLRGAGTGADTGGASGSSSDSISQVKALPSFAGGSMFRIISSAAGGILAGGEISGVTTHGNNVADYGIRMSSCQSWRIDVAGRNCLVAGVRSDNDNGALSKGNEFWVSYTWGTLAATQGSHGLWINGSDGYGHPQNIIHRCSGLVYNGHGLRLQGNVDNCLVEHCGVVLQSGGTGFNLTFLNPTTGTSAPRSNIVWYCSGGNVYADSSTRANRIFSMTSEAGEVTIVPGGQLHYAVSDYQTSGVWETAKYRLSETVSVHAASLRPDGTSAVAATAVALWPCIAYPNGVTGWAGGGIQRSDWGAGYITGIELRFVTDSANTSAAVRMRFRGLTKSSGFGLATPEVDEQFTVAVNDSANVLSVVSLNLTAPLSIAAAEQLLFRLERLGADAADTAVGNLQLLSISIKYVGNGPSSPGSGPYDVGPMGS